MVFSIPTSLPTASINQLKQPYCITMIISSMPLDHRSFFMSLPPWSFCRFRHHWPQHSNHPPFILVLFCTISDIHSDYDTVDTYFGTLLISHASIEGDRGFVARKLQWLGYYRHWKYVDNAFSRYDTRSDRDRRTDRHATSQSARFAYSMHRPVKNRLVILHWFEVLFVFISTLFR